MDILSSSWIFSTPGPPPAMRLSPSMAWALLFDGGDLPGFIHGDNARREVAENILLEIFQVQDLVHAGFQGLGHAVELPGQGREFIPGFKGDLLVQIPLADLLGPLDQLSDGLGGAVDKEQGNGAEAGRRQWR